MSVEPEDERLHPTTQTDDSLHLIINGARRHKASLVPRFLESPNARKVTIRPLRAQGVSIADTIQRQNALRTNYGDEGSGNQDLVKAGDLGAILTRTGQTLSLAVVETLSFRKSGKDMAAVHLDDLEQSGTDSIIISVQILQLEELQTTGPRRQEISAETTWVSNMNYAQFLNIGTDGIMSTKQFVGRIPGIIFHPLGPDVHFDNENRALWSLKDSDLLEVLESAWDLLNPDSDEIMSNIDLLPEVTATGNLPYTLRNGSSRLYIGQEKIPFALKGKTFDPDTLSPCFCCSKSFTIRKMRNHVGKHIICRLRGSPDPLLSNESEVLIQMLSYTFFLPCNRTDWTQPLWMVRTRGV